NNEKYNLNEFRAYSLSGKLTGQDNLKIFRLNFTYTATKENLTKLYSLFGVSFLIKALLHSSRENLGVASSFIQELPLQDINAMYLYIFNNLPDGKENSSAILGQTLNKEKILALALPINKLSWLILAGKKELLDEFDQ